MRLAFLCSLLSSLSNFVTSKNSSDCMSFYRRDIMQTWRIPQGSGLCDIKTDCTSFNVTATYGSLEIQTENGNTTLERSFASYTYYSEYPMSVLLNNPNRPKYLIFQTVENSSYFYTCQTISDDTGLGYSKYYLKIGENDIIVEGKGVAKVAYFFQFFTIVTFLVLSLVKTEKFWIASIGYPVFLFGWIFVTGVFEMSAIALALGLVFIYASTMAAIYTVSKRLPESQNKIAIWLNVVCLGFIILRCSYAGLVVSVAACIYMLSTYCCLKPSASTGHDSTILSALTNKLKEGNLFMTTWLVSIFFQIDSPLSLLLLKYQNLDQSYPLAPGVMVLVGDIIVGPIICFCVGALVCQYSSRFRRQILPPVGLTQDYFAPTDYPVYGQPTQPPVGYPIQPIAQPVYGQPPGYLQNQQTNPFM